MIKLSHRFNTTFAGGAFVGAALVETIGPRALVTGLLVLVASYAVDVFFALARKVITANA